MFLWLLLVDVTAQSYLISCSFAENSDWHLQLCVRPVALGGSTCFTKWLFGNKEFEVTLSCYTSLLALLGLMTYKESSAAFWQLLIKCSFVLRKSLKSFCFLDNPFSDWWSCTLCSVHYTWLSTAATENETAHTYMNGCSSHLLFSVGALRSCSARFHPR